MQIGYFVNNFPYPERLEHYQVGGSGVVAYYLANEVSHRHNVQVFTTSAEKNKSVESGDSLTVFRYGTNFRILTSNISLGYILGSDSYQVEIAHAHLDIPPGPIGALRYRRRTHHPLVVTYHGDWIDEHGSFLRRTGVAFSNQFLARRFLSAAEVIISPSRAYTERSELLKEFQNKTTVIPNGIDQSAFDLPYSKDECRRSIGLAMDDCIILFVGNLWPHKGPDVLMRAMSEILKYNQKSRLLLVGDGPMKRDLEILACRLGIREKVDFAGAVHDQQRKAMFYKSADVFALPSIFESFGLVNLEAMASGLPIVAFDIGGVSDLVRDKVNGFLVPPNCVSSFAHAIIDLLEDSQMRSRMAAAGKDIIKDYSWDRIARMTEKLYESCL